jgi:hypothetical protein
MAVAGQLYFAYFPVALLFSSLCRSEVSFAKTNEILNSDE